MLKKSITAWLLITMSSMMLTAHGMSPVACITEGKMTNGPVAPEYQTHCCPELKAVFPSDTCNEKWCKIGWGMLCIKNTTTEPIICTMEYMPVCGQPAMTACLEGMMCPQVMPSPQTYGNTCALNAAWATKLYNGECKDETIPPAICTREYMPVCGSKSVQCITAPCPPVQQTYGNSCMLKADNASKLYEWECKAPTPRANTILSSKITNTIDKAVYAVLSKYLDTNGRLNTDGQTLAIKLTDRLSTALTSHADMMSRSRYTARWLRQATNKGAMLQYLYNYISKLSTTRSQCMSYYDGCNTCSIWENGADACTMMYCDLWAPKIPYCTMTK